MSVRERSATPPSRWKKSDLPPVQRRAEFYESPILNPSEGRVLRVPNLLRLRPGTTQRGSREAHSPNPSLVPLKDSTRRAGSVRDSKISPPSVQRRTIIGGTSFTSPQSPRCVPAQPNGDRGKPTRPTLPSFPSRTPHAGRDQLGTRKSRPSEMAGSVRDSKISSLRWGFPCLIRESDGLCRIVRRRS
ncbi:MAG: hypothetical protein RIS76_4520 [Verrucomicrobiota bacterium]|jgi:hypothetical protein